MNFDFSQLAHRVIDGLVAGDPPSILIAIGYVLVAFGSTWLMAKTTKASAKCAYHGAKWMLTPTPASELYQGIMTKLEEEHPTVQGGNQEDLQLGEVYFYSPNSLFRSFTKIKVKGEDVTDLLTKRERKKLYKKAYAVRKATWKRDDADSARKAREAAMAYLSPPPAKDNPLFVPCRDLIPSVQPKNEVKKAENKAEKVLKEAAATGNGLCTCKTCTEARNRVKT